MKKQIIYLIPISFIVGILLIVGLIGIYEWFTMWESPEHDSDIVNAEVTINSRDNMITISLISGQFNSTEYRVYVDDQILVTNSSFFISIGEQASYFSTEWDPVENEEYEITIVNYENKVCFRKDIIAE